MEFLIFPLLVYGGLFVHGCIAIKTGRVWIKGWIERARQPFSFWIGVILLMSAFPLFANACRLWLGSLR